jgi:chromosome segregation ATPase
VVAVIGALGVAVAALTGAALNAWVTRRRQDGTIRSSEAPELWQEARDLRGFLHTQVGELQSKVNTLEERVDRLSDANDGLRFQLESATQLVISLKAQLTEITTERQHLTHELDRTREWTDALVETLQSHQIELPRKPGRRT